MFRCYSSHASRNSWRLSRVYSSFMIRLFNLFCSDLIFLADDLTERLLANVELPFQLTMDTEYSRPFIRCDYNRDGDSYRFNKLFISTLVFKLFNFFLSYLLHDLLFYFHLFIDHHTLTNIIHPLTTVSFLQTISANLRSTLTISFLNTLISIMVLVALLPFMHGRFLVVSEHVSSLWMVLLLLNFFTLPFIFLFLLLFLNLPLYVLLFFPTTFYLFTIFLTDVVPVLFVFHFFFPCFSYREAR